MCLMVSRDGELIDRPPDQFQIAADDRLLIASSPDAHHKIDISTRHVNVLSYILTGQGKVAPAMRGAGYGRNGPSQGTVGERTSA